MTDSTDELAAGGPLAARAEEIATHAHRGQVDKAGEKYIGHPCRVAAHAADLARAHGLTDDESDRLVAAAWLHDTIEDTSVTEADLRREFPAEVVEAVLAVSKRDDEPAEEYFARVRAVPLAVLVKTADLTDNTDPTRRARLDADTRDRLTAKYERACELLGIDAEVMLGR